MRTRALVGVVAAAGWAASAAAQSPPAQPPCSSEQHRQLDFWVGEWDVSWKNPDGTTGRGRNVVTSDEYGGCVITERFSFADGSFRGFSISSYVPRAWEWRQTWMDNQGNYFDLFGGRSSEPNTQFVLEQYGREDTPLPRRMVWQDVKPDSLTWRWQGRTAANEPWADQWVIHYKRAGPKSAAVASPDKSATR